MDLLGFHHIFRTNKVSVATVRRYVVSIGKANVAVSAARASALVFWDRDMTDIKAIK